VVFKPTGEKLMKEPVRLHEAGQFDDDTVLDGTPENDLDSFESFDDFESDSVTDQDLEPSETETLDVSLKETLKVEGIAQLENSIREKVENIKNLQAERSGINGMVTAEMDSLKSKGLNKKGLRMALAYLDLNEKDRRDFDLTYKTVRAALGDPIQIDLFAG
jgi:hypothetical protein